MVSSYAFTAITFVNDLKNQFVKIPHLVVSLGLVLDSIACLLHIKGIYIGIRINLMAIITPIKIRNAVILVKIPYTGPSCIPFIHCLAFDDF